VKIQPQCVVTPGKQTYYAGCGGGGGELEASQHLKGLYARHKIIKRSNKLARIATDGAVLYHNKKVW
jgi:hypothetical protein